MHEPSHIVTSDERHPSRELAMIGRVAGRRVARPEPPVRTRAGRRVVL